MSDLPERLRDVQQYAINLSDAARSTVGQGADEIERLRKILEPFAEVARWAERNGHDLEKDFDMILRGPGKQIAGHLQVQSRHFIAAATALSHQQSTPQEK